MDTALSLQMVQRSNIKCLNADYLVPSLCRCLPSAEGSTKAEIPALLVSPCKSVKRCHQEDITESQT